MLLRLGPAGLKCQICGTRGGHDPHCPVFRWEVVNGQRLCSNMSDAAYEKACSDAEEYEKAYLAEKERRAAERRRRREEVKRVGEVAALWNWLDS